MTSHHSRSRASSTPCSGRNSLLLASRLPPWTSFHGGFFMYGAVLSGAAARTTLESAVWKLFFLQNRRVSYRLEHRKNVL